MCRCSQSLKVRVSAKSLTRIDITINLPKHFFFADLSKLIQNTLLFGDMALRFPAFIHRVYDPDSAIKDVIKWSFEFVSETRVTAGTNAAHTIPMVRKLTCSRRASVKR